MLIPYIIICSMGSRDISRFQLCTVRYLLFPLVFLFIPSLEGKVYVYIFTVFLNLQKTNDVVVIG